MAFPCPTIVLSSTEFNVMQSLLSKLIQIFISFFQDAMDAVRSLDQLYRRVEVYTTIHI